MKVVVAGGGTTGHLSPGLAIADELRERGHDLVFLGSGSGPEARIVPEAGYPFHPLTVFGRGPGLVTARNARAAAALVAATARSRRLLRREGAELVLGTGGYASLPAVLAARSRGLPIVLHEQNSVPGLANRVAARFADRIGVSFPGTEQLMGERAELVGNPVRGILVDLDRAARRDGASREFGLDPGRPTLLGFGGSQGARSINTVLVGAYDLWRESSLQVLHLCGPANVEAVEQALAEQRRSGDRVVHRVVGYTDAMDMAYSCADLALCRAGASTVAELAAVGLPGIFVPLPISLDDDQRKNAEAAVASGGGRLILDQDLKPQVVVEAVQAALEGGQRLAAMSSGIRSLHRPRAARAMADLIEQAVR